MCSIIFTRRTQTGSELKAERSCNTGALPPPRGSHHTAEVPGGVSEEPSECLGTVKGGLCFFHRPSRRSPLQAPTIPRLQRRRPRRNTQSPLHSWAPFLSPACLFSLFGNASVLPSSGDNPQSLHASNPQHGVLDLAVQTCLGLISCRE